MSNKSKSSETEKPLKSPCVSICALNEEDVCVGCWRTGNEISHWGNYNNEERRVVLKLAFERAKAENPFL
jgi:predicted Fe-S protein YdhL (DUF1289 family)